MAETLKDVSTIDEPLKDRFVITIIKEALDAKNLTIDQLMFSIQNNESILITADGERFIILEYDGNRDDLYGEVCYSGDRILIEKLFRYD